MHLVNTWFSACLLVTLSYACTSIPPILGSRSFIPNHENRNQKRDQHARDPGWVPQIPSDTASPVAADSLSQASALYELFPADLKPPKWPLDQWEFLSQCCLPTVRLYHPQDASLPDVEQLIVRRDLANFKGLDHSTGVPHKSTSAYNQLWLATKQTRLPPNIALYTRTPVSRQAGAVENPAPLMHIIHVIGLAFDSEVQPDFQYFQQRQDQAGQQEFLKILKHPLTYVFRCAADHGLQTVVLSFVGGNVFQPTFAGWKYMDLFVEAVWQIMDELGYTGKLEVMGAPKLANSLSQKLGRQVPDIGRIPDVWWQPNASQKLFVNAWNPHALVGNGPGGNASLDGYIGKHTAATYLSSVLANPFLGDQKNWVSVPLGNSQDPKVAIPSVTFLKNQVQSEQARIKLVFFDFDLTLSVGHVFANLRRRGASTEYGQLQLIKELPEDWEPEDWFLHHMGGEQRVDFIRRFLERLRAQEIRCFVLTKGYVSVADHLLSAVGLREFFDRIYGHSGSFYGELPYDQQVTNRGDVVSNPSNTWEHPKAELIELFLAKLNLSSEDVLFVDDTPEEIKKMEPVCQTYLVRGHSGLTSQDCTDIENLIDGTYHPISSEKLPSKLPW